MKKVLLIVLFAMSIASVSAQKWYQYGFKIGTSFPVERQYSLDGDYLCGLRNADFGIFFRAGKYVYGEIGFGYVFYKCDFDYWVSDTSALYRDQRVVMHHLQIPIKVVGNVELSKTVSFLPYAGIIYQPLVKVKDNSIGFSMQNLTTNPVLFTTGFDLKFGPIVLGVNYRYSCQNFFQNKEGKHPQYINICAGVQL